MPQNPTGRQLLRASFDLFRQDPQMIWLPVLGAVAAFLAFAVVALPIGVGAGLGTGSVSGPLAVIAVVVGAIAGNAAAILFQVALVFAATDRIEGRVPTIGGSLAKAWGRLGHILGWAVVATTVGLVIRGLERRAGVSGALLGFLAAIGWALATLLVLPVLAFEDVGPLAALRRSTALFRSRWPTATRGSLRFGLLFFGWSLLGIVVVFLGVASVHATPFLGIPLIAVGVLGIVVVMMLASAASIYLRTVLYRYATNQPVPNLGVDLPTAFVPSGRGPRF